MLGYGALHRLPAPLSEPLAGPGETLFEGGENARFSNEEVRPLSGEEDEQANFFVPAAAAGAPVSSFLVPADVASPPVYQGGKKKGRQPRTAALDDYFMEGEKKSREVDYAPSSAKSTPPPPPPKAGGGPPKAIEKQSDVE